MMDVSSTGAYVLISVTFSPARSTNALHSSSVLSTAPNIIIIWRSWPAGQMAEPVFGMTISSMRIVDSGLMAPARFFNISTALSSDQLCKIDRR